MKRPTHLMSVPIDIPPGPAQLDELFKGMALYNTGTIALAYRVPVAIRSIRLGGVLWPVGVTCEQEHRIEIDVEARFEDGFHPFTRSR